jgi:H+/Cl- antiporter ClcA
VDQVSSTRRPSPEPLEANDQLVTAVITAAWAVALVVLLAVRTDIPASDRWWIWTCVTGLGLGVFGLLYVPFLKRSRARAAERRARARADSSAAH